MRYVRLETLGALMLAITAMYFTLLSRISKLEKQIEELRGTLKRGGRG